MFVIVFGFVLLWQGGKYFRQSIVSSNFMLVNKS
ncbi:hypothetical protein AGR1C_pTi0158 [Agrobacterium fabacearum TT111]|nr:hypothetical protein AGR1C_pTi0158 [Agrobacterium fabacearum TT111]